MERFRKSLESFHDIIQSEAFVGDGAGDQPSVQPGSFHDLEAIRRRMAPERPAVRPVYDADGGPALDGILRHGHLRP